MEITCVQPFLEYFDRVHERTRKVVACVRLRAMIETRGRGQLYFVLDMRAVTTPPIYGLASEDGRARSMQSATLPARERTELRPSPV